MALDLKLIAPCVSDRYLHLILMPTEACNFRCVYCYETFQYKRMEPVVVGALKKFLSRRGPTLEVLEVGWFGGEPLLACDVIEELMTHANTVASTHGFRVQSDITTNAYLLDRKTLRRLLCLGVTGFQISFDGPRDYHDRKRVLAGGKGTFDRVWANLLAMRDEAESFNVLVRLHADKENQEALPQFIDMYRDAFGNDARFELFVRPLSRLGGPNDASLRILDEDDTVTTALRRYASDRGVAQGPTLPEVPICYASKGNSFLIRANGRINKCTVALEHPNNQVGRILPDGTMEIDTPKTIRWMRGLQSGDTKELACPMMGLAEPVPSATVREDIPLMANSVATRV